MFVMVKTVEIWSKKNLHELNFSHTVIKQLCSYWITPDKKHLKKTYIFSKKFLCRVNRVTHVKIIEICGTMYIFRVKQC